MFCKGIFSLSSHCSKQERSNRTLPDSTRFPSRHIKVIEKDTTLILWTENCQSSDAEPNLLMHCCHSRQPQSLGQGSRPKGVTTWAILGTSEICCLCVNTVMSSHSLPPPPSQLLPQELQIQLSEGGFVLLAWDGCRVKGWSSAA